MAAVRSPDDILHDVLGEPASLAAAATATLDHAPHGARAVRTLVPAPVARRLDRVRDGRLPEPSLDKVRL
jgi:hypothetical protein